ncbi:MAG: hypothetical protein HZC02_04885 [Candidatus Levybacteria bacterium]|nr:hypothetical protein [Candidatus Levybacteria bacterium]
MTGIEIQSLSPQEQNELIDGSYGSNAGEFSSDPLVDLREAAGTVCSEAIRTDLQVLFDNFPTGPFPMQKKDAALHVAKTYGESLPGALELMRNLTGSRIVPQVRMPVGDKFKYFASPRTLIAFAVARRYAERNLYRNFVVDREAENQMRIDLGDLAYEEIFLSSDFPDEIPAEPRVPDEQDKAMSVSQEAVGKSNTRNILRDWSPSRLSAITDSIEYSRSLDLLPPSVLDLARRMSLQPDGKDDIDSVIAGLKELSLLADYFKSPNLQSLVDTMIDHQNRNVTPSLS